METSGHESEQNREESLFQEALRLDGSTERIRFLHDACGSDSALFDRLVALVTAHAQDENFIQTVDRTADLADLSSPTWEGPGSVIGRYKLLQQIGEGGMGVVYLAEQQEPIQRKVAVKIIKMGMDTKHVVARFEAERQALAMMDHPNIARVLDGGATDTGRPYFVMELVQGVPITEYCDRNNLSLTERLQLFMPICHAIHSAHRKGIIHRDIKPSNILVTLHHGDPMPKVIDFGIAKATHQKLTQKTLFTQYAQMIGTPAYMSPEQAEMSSMDVDTRSDIYSLGVLLYELLTGTTPFSVDRLKELAYGEVQRVIAEEEPPMPSTRLGTMEKDTKTALAKKRSIDSQTLTQQFKGDIDWIVMKCLEKDRRRRYETPSELVADLQRYLDHEPISAAAPSLAYQLQKLMRRHKTAFAAAAGVFAAFALGTTIATWQAIRATQAQHRAEASERTANEALERESILRQAAEDSQEEANRRLYRSLLDQARLTRVTRKPGFRAQTESLLDQAAHLDTDAGNPLELRNEAIAAMLSPLSGDLVPVMDIPREKEPHHGAFNQPFDEAAFLDKAKTLTLFQFDPEGIASNSWTLKTDPIVEFVFAPNGNYLVTGHEDRMIRVWSRQPTGAWTHYNEIDWAKQTSANRINRGDIAVKNDGFVLLERGTKHVHDWQRFSDSQPTTHQLPEIPDRRGDSLQASISPDGRILVIPASGSISVTLWDLQAKRQLSKLDEDFAETGHGGHRQTQFSPNGQYIALASMVSLDVLDAHTGEVIFSRHNQGSVVTASFSPDSSRLVFGLNDSHILHLDSLTLDHSLTQEPGYFGFSGQKQGLYQLFTLLNTNYGRVNFLPTNTDELRLLTGHKRSVREVSFAPNSKTLISSSFDSSIRQWNLNDFEQPSTIVDTNAFAPGDISFSPDGSFFATVIRNSRGTISIRDAATTRVAQEFDLGAPGFGIAFDSSGDYLAAGGVDTIKVWQCERTAPTSDTYPYQRKLIYELVEKSLGWVSEVKLSPNGQYLAFNPQEKKIHRPTDQWIHIIDLKSRERLPNRIQSFDQWRTFDFVSDDQLAVIGTTRDLELWNFRTGERERTIEIPALEQRLWRMGVSSDRRFIAFQDGRAYLSAFDLNSKQTLFSAPILPHSLTVTTLRWSSDSRLLALAGSDRTIRLLDLPLIRKRLADLDLDWKDSEHRE